ncbi:hypothetical protein LGH70_16500 [Hymenobacter sp. BT635]|uniref:Group III truncated hemoglobin n=1 Tax=Hymenobacter nitidus TaxID=2880929 RepID=A0ABS8AG19_9BACT|nr:hypothetical protein [Hymenobacter nitidus]MCB2379201.1 hypothetical protein [Hymenobacter nitidus]
MPAHLASDLSCTAQCRRFARLFTARLATDTLLGPLFSPAREEASTAEYAWWELALTGRSYHGRPTSGTHDTPLTAAHLARWCQLLDDTLAANFTGPLTQAARAALRNLATMRTHWQLVGQRRPVALNLMDPASHRLAA